MRIVSSIDQRITALFNSSQHPRGSNDWAVSRLLAGRSIAKSDSVDLSPETVMLSWATQTPDQTLSRRQLKTIDFMLSESQIDLQEPWDSLLGQVSLSLAQQDKWIAVSSLLQDVGNANLNRTKKLSAQSYILDQHPTVVSDFSRLVHLIADAGYQDILKSFEIILIRHKEDKMYKLPYHVKGVFRSLSVDLDIKEFVRCLTVLDTDPNHDTSELVKKAYIIHEKMTAFQSKMKVSSSENIFDKTPHLVSYINRLKLAEVASYARVPKPAEAPRL